MVSVAHSRSIASATSKDRTYQRTLKDFGGLSIVTSIRETCTSIETDMTRKQYKYKREHFDSQDAFLHFRRRCADAQKKWLRKSEQDNPEKRERRILRQRLYSRYYWHSDGRQTFADWLMEKYSIEDIKEVSMDYLRSCASKS